jgi:hypothetical protein
MAVKQIFRGIVEYPTPDNFTDVPSDYQYQPDNKTRYKGKGRVLTLEEAFEDTAQVQPTNSGCVLDR